ncbi:Cellobiose 2-epimerase [Alphaproteobacteria bacterium SO-S41]|nr:Cellobiose 2-epimerase [Alphaproteobacteria bacterium SO-S41]
MSPASENPRSALVRWVKRDALPLWHERGWDGALGGFVERLTPSGVPDSAAPRRMRVQARQVYVYAHAAVLGWYAPAREIALRGFEWMNARCRAKQQSGFVHIVDANGAVLDGKIDAYDQAFGLLALAWMFRLTGDAQIRSMIDAELAFIDGSIADPAHGGWREGIPAALPRRQNPQMHAFEAMLALYEATKDVTFLNRAEALLALMRDRLFDSRSGSLGEFFDGKMRPLEDPDSRVVEPGHHFEWTWLLLAYARLSGTAPSPLALQLYERAREWGIGANGFVVDEVTPEGRARKSSSRLWPQTEYIKANLALQEHGLAPDAARRADEALTGLSKTYFTAQPAGGWIDCLDEGGAVTDARMPSSTFYHVFCAIAEADRVG